MDLIAERLGWPVAIAVARPLEGLGSLVPSGHAMQVQDLDAVRVPGEWRVPDIRSPGIFQYLQRVCASWSLVTIAQEFPQ